MVPNFKAPPDNISPSLAKVSDLLHAETNQWRQEPAYCFDPISVIAIQRSTTSRVIDDSLVWVHSPQSLFTTKSAYTVV